MQRRDLIVICIRESEHSSLPEVLRGNTENENDGETEKNIEEQYNEVCSIHQNKSIILFNNPECFCVSLSATIATGPVTYTLPPPTA